MHVPLWGVHASSPRVSLTKPGHASHAVVAVEAQVANTLSTATVARVDVRIGTRSFTAPAQSTTVRVGAGETGNAPGPRIRGRGIVCLPWKVYSP